MEPKPVQQSQAPRYPTRRELLRDTAAFSLLAGLAGCGPSSGAGNMIVAPIFAHGEGSGAHGCVVVAPPVFLSEEEAMQIIREELARSGVKLGEETTFKDIGIPPIGLRDEHFKSTVEGLPGQPQALSVVGLDRDRKVGVAFIPAGKYEVKPPRITSTVKEYNSKGVAEFIAGQAKKQGKEAYYLGLFYDPLVKCAIPGAAKAYGVAEAKLDAGKQPELPAKATREEWDKAWNEYREKRRAESKRLLRQQTEDFVAWLKQQKVL